MWRRGSESAFCPNSTLTAVERLINSNFKTFRVQQFAYRAVRYRHAIKLFFCQGATGPIRRWRHQADSMAESGLKKRPVFLSCVRTVAGWYRFGGQRLSIMDLFTTRVICSVLVTDFQSESPLRKKPENGQPLLWLGFQNRPNQAFWVAIS